MSYVVPAFIILLSICIERTILTLTLSILRESNQFTVHLVYALLLDFGFTSFIVIFILVCLPWLRRLRLERTTVVSLGEGLLDPEE